MSISLIDLGTRYRMRVYKTDNQTISDANTTIITGFTKDTEVSTTQGATDYNTTLSRWTPSISGIYHISVNVFVAPPSGTGTSAANILRIKAKLMSSSGSGTLLRTGEYMSDYSDDGVYFMGVSISDIVSIDSSLYYYLEVYMDRASGNAQVVGGTSLTWFSAYKIG